MCGRDYARIAAAITARNLSSHIGYRTILATSDENVLTKRTLDHAISVYKGALEGKNVHHFLCTVTLLDFHQVPHSASHFAELQSLFLSVCET